MAADSLPPFAMWPAFPASDYYGGSAPPWQHQTTAVLPVTDLAGRWGGRRQGGSHVHSVSGQRGRCPALPLRPRHGYAAVLPHGLPTSPCRPARKSPEGVHRCPAHIRQVGAGNTLEGVPPLVHVVLHLSVLLAGPGLSGGADPSRRCRGCSRPPLRLQGRAAPSFPRPAATGRGWVPFSHPDTKRLVAHARGVYHRALSVLAICR
jgi:hypothetical protein